VPRLRAWRNAIASLSALALAGAAVLAGCNVFSPFASDAGGELTYRGLLLKGNQAINDGDYAAAADWFERAKLLNYRGSEAYLFQAKALASLYGIDYTTLNDEFDRRRNEGGAGAKGIPFIDDTTTVEKIDSIYYPVAQGVENLEHILRHARDTVEIPGGWKLLPDGDTAGDGRISEGVARLDLGLLETLKGMLGPLDLDGDNHVSRQCGRLPRALPGGARQPGQPLRALQVADQEHQYRQPGHQGRAGQAGLEQSQRHQRFPGPDARAHRRLEL
jgi:hypothetical protein